MDETGNILHKEKKRILDCQPQNNECYYDNTIYLWTNRKPHCNLFLTKAVRGKVVELMDQRFFTANHSLIHLQVKDTRFMCDRNIHLTDFRDIYLLDVDTEFPITDKMPSTDVSLFKDYSVRDQFVFNSLSQLMRTNVEALAHQHCRDTRLTHIHWSRLSSRSKSSNIQPFTIHPNSGRFILPFAENLYSFECKKKLLQPIALNNGECYQNLPVMEVSKDLTPLHNRNHTKFITPYDHLLVPYGVVVPCSDYFFAKFKLITGKWMAYTANGIIESTPPSTQLNWLDNNHTYFEDMQKIKFDVDQGLYDFSTIKNYEKLLIFDGTRQTFMTTLTMQTQSGHVGWGQASTVNVEDMFPKYPWQTIKESLSNIFVTFGRWCSVLIGSYSIFALCKNTMIYCMNCILVRRINDSCTDICTYAVSPTTYLLKRVPPSKMDNANFGEPVKYTKAPTEPQHEAAITMTAKAPDNLNIIPPTDVQSPNENMQEIRRMNQQLRLYPIKE